MLFFGEGVFASKKFNVHFDHRRKKIPDNFVSEQMNILIPVLFSGNASPSKKSESLLSGNTFKNKSSGSCSGTTKAN